MYRRTTTTLVKRGVEINNTGPETDGPVIEG